MHPNNQDFDGKLTEMQFKVTQECATEPPFQNEFWNNKQPGIYVDVVSGEPLFSSLDKFDSGTGWPSFTKPIDEKNIRQVQDKSHQMVRTEVRSRKANSHLGHVFNDGPTETGLRYCVNSAALRFIPKDKLGDEGYGDYLSLFNKTNTSADNSLQNQETAILAAGCFWGVQEILGNIHGVISTEVGYTGGTIKSPTYQQVSTGTTGHAEAVKIVFDPAKLSFKELLSIFFRLHNPTTKNRQENDVGTQYRSAIFYFDEKQRKIAEEFIRQVDSSQEWPQPVVTEIVEAKVFYPAEDYHQDYLVKNPNGYRCHVLRE